MKKLFKYLSVIVLSVVASSCSDYLVVDRYFNDRMTLENVFTSEDYTQQWLADTYSHLKNNLADVCSKYQTGHCFADDIYFGDGHTVDGLITNHYSYYKNGRWEQVDFASGAWSEAYKGIRKATIFMQNVHMVIADSRYVTEEDVKDFHAQARFVRAYYYFLLLRKYGPIPIIGDDVIDYEDSYAEVAAPRNTYDECVEFIATEMAEAAKDLPLTRPATEIARPTRGAALAARAKALIFGASPWNNPNDKYGADSWTFTDLTDDQGRLLMAQEYDDEKWAKAAAAAKDVMELGQYSLFVSPVRATNDIAYPATVTPPADGDFSEKSWPEGWADIDPYESYRSLFNGSVDWYNNPELIWSRGRNVGDQSIAAMAEHQMPISGGGWNVHGMFIKQMDTYYMADGTDAPGKDKEIGRGDGSERPTGYTEYDWQYPHLKANVSLMFANREPRFYASVGFPGDVWYGRSYSGNDAGKRDQQIFYYRGDSKGNGYQNSKLWLRSGLGIKKFVHPEDGATKRERIETAIRYADVLLWYAEALNEVEGQHAIPSWDGSTTYEISRNVTEIKKGIRPVRCRAGVPDYDQETYADVAKLRQKIYRERQIELLGEGARFYDMRRWKIAPVEENLPVYGFSVMMTEQQRDQYYMPIEITTYATLFTNKMYFWPILKSELKRNQRLTQNPGWETYD